MVADPRVTEATNISGLGWRYFVPPSTKTAGAAECPTSAGARASLEETLLISLISHSIRDVFVARDPISLDDVAVEAAGAGSLLLSSSNSFTSHALGTSMCLPLNSPAVILHVHVTRVAFFRYATYRRLFSVFEGPNEAIRGSAFPLECNFDASGAVAFDKGCYIGQELTARTKFRGEVCCWSILCCMLPALSA